MVFTIFDIPPEKKADLTEKIENWSKTCKIHNPRIYGFSFTGDGDTLDIEFHDSDSSKMYKLLKSHGYKIR